METCNKKLKMLITLNRLNRTIYGKIQKPEKGTF